MTTHLKDRIAAEYSSLLDAFANLVRSLPISTQPDVHGGGQAKVPGDLLEVFAERCLHACHALLGIMRELKRNALLNDMAGRNTQVAAASAEQEQQAAQLVAQFAALQQRIQETLQMVDSVTGAREV